MRSSRAPISAAVSGTCSRAAGVARNVPLLLLVVACGGGAPAFPCRHYDREGAHARWGRIFAFSSSATPFVLGVVIGAITSGRLRFAGDLPADGFVRPWLA